MYHFEMNEKIRRFAIIVITIAMLSIFWNMLQVAL